jgi:hypothetical protein
MMSSDCSWELVRLVEFGESAAAVTYNDDASGEFG